MLRRSQLVRFSTRLLSHDSSIHREYNPSKKRVEIVNEVTDDITNPTSIYCPNSTLIRLDSDLMIWYRVKYIKVTPSLSELELSNIGDIINKSMSVEEIDHIINLGKN